MRDWSLGAGDPLYLTLAADARLCKPDYLNDHIWELQLGGDPAGLAMRTTYGLRARAMRIWLRFSDGATAVSDPAAFVSAPRLRRFYPNSATFDFVPLENLAVTTEFWIPESQVAAARVVMTNQGREKRQIRLEVVALLDPLDGHALASTQQQLVHILAGQTGGLVPVIFVTGGPHHGTGPQPSLLVDVELGPGMKRQFTMVQAALDTLAGSFDLARRSAARPWDAELSRIELTHMSETVEIETGDPKWDAAFAFSQAAAFSMAVPGRHEGAAFSFVGARHPDLGYSRKGDGSDYPPAWSGISPLEAQYLASCMPGSPRMQRALIDSFLKAQQLSGEIDHRPGPGGQRSKLLAAPMLAGMAWRRFEASQDKDFLGEAYAGLGKFFRTWLTPAHDRNEDGTPEWDHLLQAGFDDNPLFDVWNPWSQGLSISAVHSPSLLAMLYGEAQALLLMAKHLGRPEDETSALEAALAALRKALQAAWNARLGLYLYRDRETGTSQAGKIIAKRKGAGNLSPHIAFEEPVRLMIEVQTHDTASKRPVAEILEDANKGDVEALDGHTFQWRSGGLVATTQKVYSRLDLVTVEGLSPSDRVLVKTTDTTAQDLTLALPLWAGVPGKTQAHAMVAAVMNGERFERTCGLAMLPARPRDTESGQTGTAPARRKDEPLGKMLLRSFSETPTRLLHPRQPIESAEAELVTKSVHVPWNALIGEGLLRYGFRAEAVRLVSRLMNAVIMNLVQHHSFYERYHAERGAGMGERNSLHGLAPIGLFLEALGVRILSPTRVRLEQVNLFPRPVVIRYRGLKIERDMHETTITFPNGQSATIKDRTPCIVSM